jgi:putative copper export protein
MAQVIEVAVRWFGFVSMFIALGAVGFHFGVLGRVPAIDAVMRDALDDRSATLGAIGALGWVLVTLANVASMASERSLAFTDAFNTPTLVRCGALLVALLAYVIARRGRGIPWILATLGVAVALFYRAALGVLDGKWSALVNPLHEMAGGLWIGTLFIILIAGIGAATSRFVSGRMSRGTTVALLVRAFSPLALGSAALLVTMGVITAIRHFHHLNQLWTTPFGYTLIVKLCVVALVLIAGAWNWRRVGPSLGGDSAVANIRRSARVELTLAAIVLVVTAILVGMPHPPR